MLDLLMIIVFCWLFFKALGLVFRLAWGVTKILVGLLVTAAAMTLVGGVLFAGGLVLLIPIALGAMLLGPTAGAVLGFIYGMTVFVSLGVLHMDPFTAFLFDHNPVATFLICTVKSTAAGLVAGLVYRALSRKSSLLAVFVASALVPTINTGVFVIGCFTIYNTISQVAAGSGYSAVYFILIICAGANYALELAINLIFSPALERITRILSKRIRRR